MKEKHFLLAGLLFALIILVSTKLFKIQPIIIIYNFLAVMMTVFVITLVIDIYLIYLRHKFFKFLKNNYDELTHMHQAKYKCASINYNNPDLTNSFEMHCNNFINSLEKEETKKLVKFTSNQKQLLEKMLVKAKEMKTKEYILDYSL